MLSSQVVDDFVEAEEEGCNCFAWLPFELVELLGQVDASWKIILVVLFLSHIVLIVLSATGLPLGSYGARIRGIALSSAKYFSMLFDL